MAILNVKIVGIEGDSVLVKYATDNSAKSIDEYDAVAYQPKALGYSSVDQFIEGIKPSLLDQAMHRDNLEQVPEDLDLSDWHGHESAHVYVPLNNLNLQTNPALTNPQISISEDTHTDTGTAAANRINESLA